MPAGYEGACLQRRWGSPADYRGEFGRDRDRVLYCSSFRRLAGKTQVVAAGEHGDFHNRMTHTLKVAQLGRRMAQRLQLQAAEQGLADLGAEYPVPDPELVEAACLAHDLGHPPFGHAGEQALMKAVDAIKMEEAMAGGANEADARNSAIAYGGFEGNAQTLRILTRLSARHPRESRGLDLTRAVLDATIKYPWVRLSDGPKAGKWNVYPGDKQYAEWVRLEAGLGEHRRKSFEAQLMDWCDDVTYACHDVEDFYRAGIIPLDQLFAFPPVRPGAAPRDDEPPRLREFFDFVEAKWNQKGQPFNREEARLAWRAIGQLMLVDGPFDGSRDTKVATHRATSAVMSYFIESVTWSPDRNPCLHEADLNVSHDARLRCDLLQELIWYFVIGRPALASQQLGQQRMVRDLLDIYYRSDDGRLLPDDRKEEAFEHGDKLRACIDHIASMTEHGAVAIYHRLTGVRTGLHSDPIWRT